MLFHAHDGTSAYRLYLGLFRVNSDHSLRASQGTLAALCLPHLGQHISSNGLPGAYTRMLPICIGLSLDKREIYIVIVPHDHLDISNCDPIIAAAAGTVADGQGLVAIGFPVSNTCYRDRL